MNYVTNSNMLLIILSVWAFTRLYNLGYFRPEKNSVSVTFQALKTLFLNLVNAKTEEKKKNTNILELVT